MEVQELDDAVEKLPTDKPVVIITPSYEGRPPDNAKKFVAWLEKLAAKKSQLPPGTKFAVFGVGNSDWVHTFHRVPRLIDDTLVALGCERILDVDFANVKRDLTGPWEAWSEKLCLTLSGMSWCSSKVLLWAHTFSYTANITLHHRNHQAGAARERWS